MGQSFFENGLSEAGQTEEHTFEVARTLFEEHFELLDALSDLLASGRLQSLAWFLRNNS